MNCMHFMSFDELKEMEVSRDDGDGRSDHRHFGGGRAHTPLHVSKDSDAGHKSSWYHYLKTKCHGEFSSWVTCRAPFRSPMRWELLSFSFVLGTNGKDDFTRRLGVVSSARLLRLPHVRPGREPVLQGKAQAGGTRPGERIHDDRRGR